MAWCSVCDQKIAVHDWVYNIGGDLAHEGCFDGLRRFGNPASFFGGRLSTRLPEVEQYNTECEEDDWDD